MRAFLIVGKKGQRLQWVLLFMISCPRPLHPQLWRFCAKMKIHRCPLQDNDFHYFHNLRWWWRKLRQQCYDRAQPRRNGGICSSCDGGEAAQTRKAKHIIIISIIFISFIINIIINIITTINVSTALIFFKIITKPFPKMCWSYEHGSCPLLQLTLLEMFCHIIVPDWITDRFQPPSPT